VRISGDAEFLKEVDFSQSYVNAFNFRQAPGVPIGPDTTTVLFDLMNDPDLFYLWDDGERHSRWRYGIGELEYEIRLPTHTIVGFQFMLADGVHYGWLEYEADGNHSVNNSTTPDEDVFAEINVIAWGWETTPNTSILPGAGVPAPSSAAVLGFAGAMALRRKR